MTKSRVFISSVQKELENERIGAQEVLWTDPFLKKHCDPVLYEFEPASAMDATKECLEEIETCQYFALIVGNQYLMELGVLRRAGRGRLTKYVLDSKASPDS